MNKSLGCWILLMLGLAVPAAAAEPVPGWTGTLGLGFSLTRGNTETTNLSANASANNAFAPRWEWLNSAFVLTQSSDGEKKAESGGFTSRVNWNFMTRWLAYGEVGYLKDRFKDFQYRWTPGVGVGYKMIEAENQKLTLLGGVTRVLTRYYSTHDTESYTGLKAGNTFWMKLSPTADFNQAFEIVSDVSKPSRWFAKLDLGLSAALTQRLAVTFSLKDTYDAKPVDPSIKKNDLLLMAGLTLKY